MPAGPIDIKKLMDDYMVLGVEQGWAVAVGAGFIDDKLNREHDRVERDYLNKARQLTGKDFISATAAASYFIGACASGNMSPEQAEAMCKLDHDFIDAVVALL